MGVHDIRRKVQEPAADGCAARLIAATIMFLTMVAGCGRAEPTATPTRAATLTTTLASPTPETASPTGTPAPPTVLPPPTATSIPRTSTATPSPIPTATATAGPTPIPPLALEKSPQLFGFTETFQVGLGDLDGDGDLDAVFANMGANDSKVWLNDGTGHFVDSGQQLTRQGHGVGVGDLDGDGDQDLFITCAHFGSLGALNKSPSQVYLNDGNGTFQNTGQDLGDTALSGNGVNLIDVDSDGDLDVHVVYYEIGGAPDKVYLNDGQGRFTDSGIALAEEVIAWGDLDSDGDVDILGKAFEGEYRTLLNDGTGRFSSGWHVADSQITEGDIALDDFDGDGDLDALVANGFRSEGSFPTLLLVNDGSGQFTDSGQRLNETMGADLGVGDLDKDGDLDVYVANMDWPNEVWLNDGTGSFVDSSLRLQGAASEISTKPSLGDLDGDGDLDVFVGSFRGQASIWLNQTLLRGGDGGVIAFVSTRDGNGEIYVMDLKDALHGVEDGTKPRRLTHWRDWDGYPSWSPDGKHLAFYTHLNDKNWVIQVMDVPDAYLDPDGSDARRLTDKGVCDGIPTWSPDGAWIAYTSDADCGAEHRDVYVMHTDGSNQRNLTHSDADDLFSSWSPDGRQIVFSSNRDGDYEIYILDVADALRSVDDGDVRQLTENDAQDRMPAWSPDGSQIAFVSDRDGNDEVYVMEIGGTNVQRLTDNPAADWFPAWSPDGAQIVFSSRRDGNLEIYIMDRVGSNVQRLTNNAADDFSAVWRPLSADESGSQEAPDSWVKTFQSDPRWAAQDALLTGSGLLLVGSTNYSHNNTRREDIYVVKTDVRGQFVWGKAFGGDAFDRGNAIIAAHDGAFVILGETASFGAGDWDMYLLKADQDGNELWSRTFGGPRKERANAIQHTADGGYILAGQTASFGAGGSDLYLIKVDDLGNEIWSRTYGGEHDESGYAIHQTADGDFLVLGQVTQDEAVYVDQNPDIFLLKTDSGGEEMWAQVWENENVEGGHVLLPTSDGHYVIAGITGPAGSQTHSDFLLIKMDADGKQIWNKRLGDEDAVDYGTDVMQLPDGGFLLSGMLNRRGRGAIPLIKTDADGEILWTRNLVEGAGNKAAMKILPAPDGGYLIVGVSDEYRRAFETILIKTDSEGKVTE